VTAPPAAGRRLAVLIACCLGFFWAQTARAVLYSVMPAVSLELGLDAAQVGLVTGVLYGSYSVALYVSGFVPLPRRVVVVVGFVIAALGNVAFALTQSLGAMMVVATVGGIGAGVYLPRGTAALVETFEPARRARALGWHELAASAGLVVAPLFIAAALLVVSWRVAVAAWSVVGLATAAVAWQTLPDGPRRAAAAGPGAFDARAVALACMGAASFAVISGFFTMLPTMAAQAWRVSPSAAAGFTGWTRTGGMAGALLGGWAADAIGRMPSVVGFHAIALAAALSLPFLPYGVGLGVVVLVMALAASAAATAYYALLGDTYRPEERERVFGPIQATASLLGSAATPVALGLVLARLSPGAALLAITAAPLLGLSAAALYRACRR
jgi:predicted MFS family arabinose efflux permease